jgi:hypothetical protein
MSHQAATSPIAPATPSSAFQSGRTNASAAIALSPNRNARARLHAETGKSNQSAPKVHAMPVSNWLVSRGLVRALGAFQR